MSEEMRTAGPARARSMRFPDVDPELELLIPADDEPEPELSIVVPALNEERTIAEFVAWCHEGIAAAGVRAEILIVDSSTDHTPDIAVAHGARVLCTPKRGLGRAYIDALPFVRGRYLVLGDCDCTYDFRELAPFVERFHEGYDFVMGSRFRGSIEDGAMPALHRHLGTPVTTWMLNRVHGSRYSDIHCGMRGITRDAFVRMGLRSQSWEYASEMVLKAAKMELRTAEVPVSFYKDRDGRLSHHKRSGWTSPWKAAWINIREMFVYGADFFAFWPGVVMFALGLALTLAVSAGPVDLGPVTLSLNWMLLGAALAILGLQAFFFGVLAQVMYDWDGTATRRWLRVFSYTRALLACGLLVAGGIALAIPLVVRYASEDFTLAGGFTTVNYLAVLGGLMLCVGFMGFLFTLVVHALAVRLDEARAAAIIPPRMAS